MRKQLLQQFYFSKAERIGAACLLLLALVAFLLPEIYGRMRKPAESDFRAFSQQLDAYFNALDAPGQEQAGAGAQELFPFDPNTASVETLVRLGLSPKVAGTIVKYRERGGRFRSAADLEKIYVLPEADAERLKPYVRIPAAGEKQQAGKVFSPQEQVKAETFPFDPNTASEQDLLRLGLPRALVGRLLRYREKGGYFLEKTDFRKLYGLVEADYARLEPYITIAKSDLAVRPAAYAGGGWAKPAAAVLSLDVNSATPDDWRQLPGIGAARAHRIVRYRDKLGGFTSLDQVAETYDLPDSVFQQIRPLLRLHSPVYRPLNINTVSEAELRAHPYFNFKQAQLIVAYREQHGPFTRVEDVERIAAFTDRQWLEKVKPYLAIDSQ